MTNIGYVAVDETTVPIRNGRAARAALAYARRDLGLPPLRIRWFDIAPPGATDAVFVKSAPGVDGRCDTRAVEWDIWVRRGLTTTVASTASASLMVEPMTPARTASVVLHEAFHASDQRATCRVGKCSPEIHQEGERRAKAYAYQNRKLAARMGAPGWP